MSKHLKLIAPSMILFGILLLLAEVDETFNLHNAPYVLIILGFILLVVSLLTTNKEKSLLCRIGLHKYQRISEDSEIPAMFLYKCDRCGKEKKAATIL